MKLRIVQDHTAAVQPWFRLETWADTYSRWMYEESGTDIHKLRARMAGIANPPDPPFTVIEEHEL